MPPLTVVAVALLPDDQPGVKETLQCHRDGEGKPSCRRTHIVRALFAMSSSVVSGAAAAPDPDPEAVLPVFHN